MDWLKVVRDSIIGGLVGGLVGGLGTHIIFKIFGLTIYSEDSHGKRITYPQNLLIPYAMIGGTISGSVVSFMLTLSFRTLYRGKAKLFNDNIAKIRSYSDEW